MPGPIIVAVDPDEAQQARDAVALAAVLATVNGSALHAVTICPPESDRAARERAVAALFVHASVPARVTALVATSPARRLHELCDHDRPATLVIGSGRRSPAGDARLGEVAEPLLHGGGVPVAIAVAGYASRSCLPDTIGIAFAGTPESQDALRHATALANAAGARLKILTVPEAAEAGPLSANGIEPILLDGDPATALAAASSHLDLLVVGSRSYGPLGAVLLGAVTRELVPTASCPVIVVPRIADPAHEVALLGGLETEVIA